jgi:hypothetical protein
MTNGLRHDAGLLWGRRSAAAARAERVPHIRARYRRGHRTGPGKVAHALHLRTILAAAALFVSLPAAAEDLEDTLRSRWLGAWVVTTVETYSGCDGGFSNNDVNGVRVVSKAPLGLAAGELARVDKLNLKGSRVDLYLVIAEPLRIARQEGPFTLFGERPCKVQLLIDAPGKEIRAGNLAAVEAAITQAVTAFDTREQALASPAWNQRVREPLPDDYPETLARYEAWRAEQVNARLAEVREQSIDEADRVVDRLEDDPRYLEGFAAGAAALRYASPPSCDAIVTSTPTDAEREAPREHRGDTAEQRSWRRGYRDGQFLAFNIAIARAVRGCFLLPPPAAAENSK